MPWSAVLTILVLLAVACASGADVDGALLPEVADAEDDAAVRPSADLARPEAVVVPCDPPDPDVVPDGVDPSDGVECGVVVLPEDRGDPTGPVVEVAYTRLAARPPPDGEVDDVALVVLADGPGDAMTDEVGRWLDSTLRTERDLVLLDDRGAGRSFPLLDCGEPPSPGDLPLDLVQDCRRDLTAAGVRLDAHTTADIADDVVDVATALGLPEVALLGVGHGARVALEVLRRAPDRLAAVVLDSPSPPEVDVLGLRPATAQAAVNRLFDDCAQTPRCDRSFGGLRDRVVALVGRMNAAAAAAEAPTVDGDALVRGVLAAMRGADGPAAVPAALASAVDGDLEAALAALRSVAVAGQTVPATAFSEGLRLSVQCHDRVPFAGTVDLSALDAIGRAVAADVAALREACEIWDVGRAQASLADPVTGPVPTLVMTGEFDPYSPAAWGAGVVARMDHGQVVQVDGAGHRVHDADNCTTAIVAAFLRAPLRPVNDACAADRVVDFVGS